MFDSVKYEIPSVKTVPGSLLPFNRTCSIRDCLTQLATELLVQSLVISRLVYGNSLLYGLSDQLLDKLQRVQNPAARVVTKASRYDDVTPILETLHWLPVRYRIQYMQDTEQCDLRQSPYWLYTGHISVTVIERSASLLLPDGMISHAITKM